MSIHVKWCMVYSIFIPDGAKSMLHRILICFNCVFALVLHYPMEVGCHDMTRYLVRNSYGSDQSKLGQHIPCWTTSARTSGNRWNGNQGDMRYIFLFKLDPKKSKLSATPNCQLPASCPNPVNRAGKLLSSSIRPSFMAHFSPFRGISALERRSRWSIWGWPGKAGERGKQIVEGFLIGCEKIALNPGK